MEASGTKPSADHEAKALSPLGSPLAGEPVHQLEARQAHQGQAEAQQQTEEHPAKAEDYRVIRALEQKGRGVQRELETCFQY